MCVCVCNSLPEQNLIKEDQATPWEAVCSQLNPESLYRSISQLCFHLTSTTQGSSQPWLGSQRGQAGSYGPIFKPFSMRCLSVSLKLPLPPLPHGRRARGTAAPTRPFPRQGDFVWHPKTPPSQTLSPNSSRAHVTWGDPWQSPGKALSNMQSIFTDAMDLMASLIRSLHTQSILKLVSATFLSKLKTPFASQAIRLRP